MEFFFLIFLWVAIMGLFSWILNLNNQFLKTKKELEALKECKLPESVRQLASTIESLTVEINKLKLMIGPQEFKGNFDPHVPPLLDDEKGDAASSNHSS